MRCPRCPGRRLFPVLVGCVSAAPRDGFSPAWLPTASLCACRAATGAKAAKREEVQLRAQAQSLLEGGAVPRSTVTTRKLLRLVNHPDVKEGTMEIRIDGVTGGDTSGMYVMILLPVRAIIGRCHVPY